MCAMAEAGTAARSTAGILRKFMDRLAGALDPIPVSTKLYAQAIIGQQSWEHARSQGASYDRNLALLEAVQRSVRSDEQYFDKFCDVLKQEEVTVRIAQELIDERDRLLSSEPSHDIASDHDREGATSDEHEESPKETSKSTKRSSGGGDGRPKRRVVLKEGRIPEEDNFLMEIARDIGGKWEEVGVALKVPYKVLKSVVASGPAKSEHMRAFDMLQEWSDRAADEFTYRRLASALESTGLNTCARQHCYTSIEP